LKEIFLVGNGDSDMLKKLQNSPHFKIQKTQNPQKAEKLIKKCDPDFVLCSGTIQIDRDGNYYIEL